MRDMNESQGKAIIRFLKMLALAFDGITSLSVKPIRIITALGTVIAGLSFLGGSGRSLCGSWAMRSPDGPA